MPDAGSLADRKIVPLVGLGADRPVGGLSDPALLREEDRLGDEGASNLVGAWRGFVADADADGPDPVLHLIKGRAAVARSEGLPGQPRWEPREPHEEAEAADGGVGAL